MPKEIPVLTSSSSLGATFEEVNRDYLDKHSLENGVKIAKLTGGKLASVGMKEGFVITSINKKKVFKYNISINLKKLKKVHH